MADFEVSTVDCSKCVDYDWVHFEFYPYAYVAVA